MCGIAGSINSDFSYQDVIKTMGHRGPNEQNGYTDRNVIFFHLRLSILDIAGGKQPMHLGNKYTIIFNGEIYNHSEVRKQFNLTGYTSSDTETLLLLYERFGTQFLEYLDGMFAFVIHDKIKNKLFIARDRSGKKPFYYYHNEDKFVFASELNCLKSMVPLEINSENFYHYLRLGTFYRQFTPYKNVTELIAGSFLVVDCESLSITQTRWWNINDFYRKQSNDSIEEALQKTDDYLHTAVKRRIESSDLEVGCFLSAGIDSGIITSIAREYNNKLKTFTVSFVGEYNEAPLAKLVAEKYKTQHTEIKILFSSLKTDLEKILSNYGEPISDGSVIPSYYVSKEAKKHVTVVLNGDGADELFGGYRRYVPFAGYDFFKKNFLVKKGASFFKSTMPQPENKRSTYNYLYRLASLASKSSLEIYLSAGADIFEDYEDAILKPGFDYLQPIKNDFDSIADSNLSGLKKIMNLDFDVILFSDFLVKMDIATMANSQEGRSPFLSKELLEYVPPLNDSYKIKGKTTKYILRKLAVKYLPPTLINQPKRGFEIPLKNWVDNELKETVFDYLTSPQCFYKNFVKQNFVHDLLSKKINISGEKRAKILWTLLSMEIWYKKVYK
ncbi:asparagine synthase (glutamine-hydrolyzing) [Ginsengibacter hankyongi]|uniref:asparagine synthase (glutamine-hydrolyzing) n=1 Tax=Ginsengibacter hankyongi TaxID=2607284 RepID=A0A5J5ILC1_9BACT|nr:asparagine synthase (glutamine-hydrolyzing) [Ginsengibacter hankyongi]KAA9041799.1 asparagine synthase (glutamine-hydrolyzing) [Ginsengibacter hankyongi]